ncbi:hypothetical protein Tco_0393166 [Tanacetum coccineum]
MAVLESCPKHNMVAYLEKTEGNAEFMEVIDFLAEAPFIMLIYSLLNQAIFDAIQLMGYEGDLTGKHFSRKVTPLFASMLVQSTEDEGATSERSSEPQPTPSLPHPSEANVEPPSDPSPRPSPTSHIRDSILENQAKEIQRLKAQIKKLKKLKKQAKPVITHHRAWMRSVYLKQRLAGKRSLKKTWMQKESVSKQGRKSAKGEPSIRKDSLFDEIPEDTFDYMETEDAQDVRRSRDVVNEEKENADAKVSTDDVLSIPQEKVSTNTPKVSTNGSKVSIDKEKVSTDTPKVSTDRSKVSTDKEKDSTERTDEGADDQTEGRRATQTIQTPTSTMFGDDETIAQALLNMSQAKAVSREKDKGLKRSLSNLLVMKRWLESCKEDWETEEERKRLAEEEATNDVS